MRHRKLRGKLGRTSAHRKALLRNLVRGLVIQKRIRTTVTKAKVVRAFAERMIEIAKRGDLQARRLLISHLGSPQTANLLITQIAPHFKERQGGYTRILKIGGYRPGDGAAMALLEFTATIELPKKPRKEKASKTAKAKKETEISETLEKPKKAAKTKEAAEKDETSAETPQTKGEKAPDKKESEKKGGFLRALRKFLKGDEESH